MPYELVVVRPFADQLPGARISDPEEVERLLAEGRSSSVVKVWADEPEPEPKPAPEAHPSLIDKIVAPFKSAEPADKD